jgi:hypothetical protein
MASTSTASFSGMVDVALEGDSEAPVAPEPSRVVPRDSRPAEKDGTREVVGPSSRGFTERAKVDDTGETQMEKDDAPLIGRSRNLGVGGGMVALEVISSSGDSGLDLVLDDDRWRWRHTVSYWVCISFILGSLLFIAGCAFWYKHYAFESRKRALVTYPFLFGSIMFTTGSYLGVFQAANVGARGPGKLWRWAPEKDGFLGYFYYFVGALVFNVSCVEPMKMFDGLPNWAKREMAWGAAEIGSFFFVLGAWKEVTHNKCLDVRACYANGKMKTLPFWLSWNNLSGACCFLLAACAGRFDPESPGWVYTTYLVGSLNFFLASSMMLFMWKGEQYGLGFIPSINRLVPLRAASVADVELRAAGKGYRRVSKTHFVFIQMYIALTGASFIDFCFATQRFSVYSQGHGFAHFHEVVASLMGVFMSVGLLFMASVLHHTPRIHPFDKLLWWVNFYVFVKLIQITMSIFEYYTVALEVEERRSEETAANAAFEPPPST